MEPKQGLIALHSAVLLFAISGLFGKWLTLPAVYITFGRAAFAALAILLLLQITRKSIAVSKGQLAALAATGVVLAFHWASFFHAIQIASVAIGLITFATFPVFVSFLEPYLFNEKWRSSSLYQALFTVLGVYLVLPKDSWNSASMQGIYWGIASALSFAMLTIMNRKFVKNISAKTVAMYQNGVAALCLAPILWLVPITITLEQWGLLLILGIIFTAFAHSLFNHSLKSVKAHTASIAVSLEPVYGILAAFLLLGEQLSFLMLLGGVTILLTNVWAIYDQRKALG